VKILQKVLGGLLFLTHTVHAAVLNRATLINTDTQTAFEFSLVILLSQPDELKNELCKKRYGSLH